MLAKVSKNISYDSLNSPSSRTSASGEKPSSSKKSDSAYEEPHIDFFTPHYPDLISH